MLKAILRSKFIFLFFLAFTVTLKVSAQRISTEWAKNTNGTTVVTTNDKQGNVYLTGTFRGDTLWYNDIAIATVKSYTNGFIVKLDHSGSVIWTKVIGKVGKNNAMSNDIKVDDSGNVYVTGMFTGDMDFGPGQTFTSKGNWDAFTAKLNSDGDYIWVYTMEGEKYVVGHYLAIDSAGNVFTVGQFQGTADLNPGSGVDTFAFFGTKAYNRFISKVDSSGNYLWGLHFEKGSNLTDVGGLALDPSGNAYITGSYFSNLAFPAGSGIATLYSVAPYDMYLLKINPSGSFVWAKSFGGIGDGNFAFAITSDNDYNLYLTGSFNRTANLNPGSGPPANFTVNPKGSSLSYDMFALKVDTGGNYIWAKTFGSPFHDNSLGIAVDQAKNVYLTGSFQDTINFVSGSTAADDQIISHGGYDVFVVKFDATGEYKWSTSMGAAGTKPFGGNGPNRGDNLTVDRSGNVYVAGLFKDIVDFDPGAGTAILNAKDKGPTFLLKLSCNDTSFSRVEASSCSTYTLNDITYDSSGLYIQKMPNAAGCDSTIYLSLTINPALTPVITINGFVLGVSFTYSTYQWLLDDNAISGANADTYTVLANGEYRVIVTNEEGCVDTSDVYEVKNVTGINDRISIARELKIYPNPAKDVIHILSPIAINIQLTSIEGKIMINKSNVRQIPIEHLPSGIYFLKILDKHGELIKVEKVVKSNKN